jgi:hypothetical protein
MDHINYNSPYYTPAHNHYYWEPQLPPSIQIHPQSAAGQLGYTPEQLAPILREQQQFLLAEELAQPPRVLTRPATTSYHRTTRIEANPNPAVYTRPQQEAAELGIGPEELAAISEQAVREQAEWLAKEEAEWRNREEERWRGEWGTDREHAEEETEEAETQEQHEHDARQVHTTVMRPRSTPPPHVHPQSATAQLGLTPEEAEEVHNECIRAQEEIRKETEEEDRARRERIAEQGTHDTHPPLPEHPTYDTTSDHDAHVVSLEYQVNDGGTASPIPERNAIGQLEYELDTLRVGHGNWAEEVDMVLSGNTQGEYTGTGYTDPTPAPPPPAPWYPPQPPTSEYPPPQTQYLPPHQWYSRTEAHHTPRRPCFHPRTHPHPKRRPQLENRTSHVTATRRARLRTTTRAEHDESPRYVPPALRSDHRTSWRSRLPKSRPSADWRDPPPHIDPPTPKPRRSESPNWRAPSPNRPVSFRNPSPPPQSPNPSTSSLHPPETVRVPPRHHTQSQLTSELIGIIKTTSEALQSIVRVAEKLIRQVNASRRLAHRPQKFRRSLREDAPGNVGCSSPPTFPSGRRVSVTGSPGVSDPLA